MYEPFHLRVLSSPASFSTAHARQQELCGGSRRVWDRISAVIDARSIRPEADRYYEAG